jgi:hypothetical protein
MKGMLPGRVFKFGYEGAMVGKNEYVSAVIKDTNDGRVLYYGKLATSLGSGTFDMKIPNLPKGGDYLVGIFNEQCNDNSSTDYIGSFHTMPLHIQ